jgi:hypothetical protein
MFIFNRVLKKLMAVANCSLAFQLFFDPKNVLQPLSIFYDFRFQRQLVPTKCFI